MNITTQESQEDSKSQSQVYNKIRKITSHHKHSIFLNHIRKCVKSQSIHESIIFHNIKKKTKKKLNHSKKITKRAKSQ